MSARFPRRAALVLLLLGGCGPDSVDDLRIRSQRVIFGGPSGFDLEEMTAAVPGFTGDQQRIAWEQIATLRGTTRFQPLLSFGSVNIFEEGSGQLTGGNLAFTANHVAEPSAAPILQRTARFDADRYPWARKNLDEGCVPFQPPPDNPALLPSPSVDDWHTKLRLKALGLHGRLDDRTDQLIDLEVWEYETVREWGVPTDTGVSCASDGDCRSPDGAVCRDYDEDGTRTCTVRAESDIALVRFKEKAIDTQGGIPGFILSGPGAIFDYQLPQTLIDGADTAGLPREIENRDRSTLYHVNLDMSCLGLGENEERQSPSESYERMVNTDGIVEDPSYVPRNDLPLTGPFFSTTQDTKGGSSGGAVHVRLDADRALRGQWLGVHKGCETDNGDIPPCTDPDDDTWVFEDSGLGFDFNAIETRFTEAQSAAVAEFRANLGHPFLSVACTPGDPTSCYDECHAYCTDPANAGEPSCEAGCANQWRASELDDRTETIIHGCSGRCGPSGAAERGHSEGRLLSCRNYLTSGGAWAFFPEGAPREPAPSNSAMGLGVLGGPTGPNDALALGAIGIICGPYSLASWSRNWDFVAHRTVDRSDDHIQNTEIGTGRTPYEGASLSFSRLTMAYMDRHPDYLAPQPFQMCPPGHSLIGLRTLERRDESRGFVGGVVAVRCAPTEQLGRSPCQNADETSYPCLVPTAEPGRLTGFAFNERATLDQEIGQIMPRADLDEHDLICPPEYPIVSGIRTSDNDRGSTKFLELECQEFIRGNPGARVLSTGASADTYVLRNRTANFGASLDMQIGGAHRAHSLLKVDLESVQQRIANGTITRVVLEFPIAIGADSELSVRIHRLTQEWTEHEATWDCASLAADGSCAATWNLFEHPGQGSMPAPGRDRNFPQNPWIQQPTATATIDSAASSFQIDVTADVEAMIASGTNYGWILISDGQPNVTTVLNTRESGNGPELVIDFDPALPEPTRELAPNDVFLQVNDGIALSSPEPTMSWFVNGIEGGNAEVGVVSAAGFYTAPPSPPTPATVQVGALTTTGEFAVGEVTVAHNTIDPSAGEAKHRFFGADAGDGTGQGFFAPRNSVASGDLNSDGADDIIIGVPGGDSVGNSISDAGEVGVYFGSSGLASDIDMRTSSPDVIIWGDGLAGRFLGSALAIADLDGDGHDDLIVSETDPAGAGFVHVFFGDFTASQSINLLTDNADLTIWSSFEAGFGWRLGAGDVDADGVTDLIIESRLADGPGGTRPATGALHVVAGGPTLRTAGTLDLSTQAPRSTIFLPAAQNEPPGAPPVAGAYAKRLEGVPLSIGDVSGDGVADIVVGRNSAEEFAGPIGGGSVFVVFGGALPQTVDLGNNGADVVVVGEAPVDLLGFSTAVADVTGDGAGDLLAAAPGIDGNGRTDAGGVWVLPGPLVSGTFYLGSTGPPGAIRVVGPRGGGFSGYALGVVQADSDPNVEIVLSGCIGRTGADGACGPVSDRELCGEVYVVELAAASSRIDLRYTPMDLVAFGSDAFDRFGASLYRANTDGVVPDEVVVGAPEADGPNEQRNMAGEVLVISAAP